MTDKFNAKRDKFKVNVKQTELEALESCIHAVILCGGSGTRLWPLSRKKLPKQYLSLGLEKKSLLATTLARIQNLSKPERRWIVTSESQRELAKEQTKGLVGNVLIEPVPRNTAPAIAWAAWEIMKKDPEAIMVIVSSDQVIQNVRSFEQSILDAVHLAKKNYFVTIGVQPTFASTGFGYIEKGLPLDKEAQILPTQNESDLHNNSFAYSVRSFREKPNQAAAEQFLRTGKYLWNSAMFVWKAKSFWNAFGHIEPEISKAIASATPANFAEVYASLPNIPIDTAFLEQTSHLACVPAAFDWNDVGSWSSVRESFVCDDSGNSLVGDVFTLNSNSCVIHAQNIFVAAVGLQNIAVVATKDAVLVMPLDQSQDVKKVVAHLEKNNRQELL